MAVNISNAMGGLTGAFGAAKQAAAAEGEANIEGFRAKSIIQKQADVGELQAQNNAREFATSAGTNMDVNSEIVSQIGETMRNTALSLNKQSRVVSNMESNNNLFSSPLGFMYDLLYGDEERGKLDGLKQQMDIATKSMESLNQATQQTVVTQNAIAITKTDATVSANQDYIAAQANVAAAQARGKVAGLDVDMIQALDVANARQTQISLAIASNKRAIEQQAWGRAEAEASKKARGAVEAANLETVAMYNRGAEALGKPVLSGVPALSNVLKFSPKDEIAFIFQTGSSLGQGQVPQYGTTAAAAIGNVQKYGLKINPAQKNMLVQATNTLAASTDVNQVAAYIMENGLAGETVGGGTAQQAAMNLARMWVSKPKDHPDLAAQVSQWKINKQAADQNYDGDYNIFKLPPMNVLADKKHMKEDPFLSKFVLPMLTADAAVPLNLTQLYALASTASTEGMATSDIFDSISWITNQLWGANLTTKNYGQFGITVPNVINLPVKIEKSGLLGGTSQYNVNILDEADVQAKGIQYLRNKHNEAAEIARQKASGSLGNLIMNPNGHYDSTPKL